MRDEELRDFLASLADDWDMDAAEALSMITAAANLTITLERFMALAEELYPVLIRRRITSASQSGGPVARTSTSEAAPPTIDNATP